MDPMFEDGQELVDAFFKLFRANTPRSNKLINDGFYVSAKVKRDIQLSEMQNKCTFEGEVRDFYWNNLGDGIYKVYMEA